MAIRGVDVPAELDSCVLDRAVGTPPYLLAIGFSLAVPLARGLVEAGRLPDEDAGLVGVVADDDGHLLEGPAADRRRLDDVGVDPVEPPSAPVARRVAAHSLGYEGPAPQPEQ